MNALYIDKVMEIAGHTGWEFICHQQNICMLSFKKEGMRVNVYYSKGTVGTSLLHPKKGKTQLFRKRCGYKDLYAIFNNPRVHTRKGYYKK